MRIPFEPPIDRVLSRLQQVTEDGNGWLARCPAQDHEDHHPSLKVDVGDDGVTVGARSEERLRRHLRPIRPAFG
jgi:hypothetical protein